MTNKNFIIRYILLKIILGKYPPLEFIPSENNIAKKFKCTRMLVREAYLKLIDHNILSSKQGSGYYVNENAIDSIFFLYSYLKNFDFKLNKKNLNVIDIYKQNNCIGFLTINVVLKFDLTKFSITDILVNFVNEYNFNFSKIINKFTNNLNINNVKMNKFSSIFISENNTEVVFDTYLNSNLNFEIIKEFKF